MSFRDLVDFIVKHRDQLILVALTAAITLILTKLLPYLISLLGKLASYFGALVSGRRKDYDFEQKYTRWLAHENRYLPVIPTQVVDPGKLARPPRLEDVYIRLQLRSGTETASEFPAHQLVEEGGRTVILGDPGAGKTTFLRFLGLTYARLRSGRRLRRRERRELRERFQTNRGLVPVAIVLNQLSTVSKGVLDIAREALPENLQAVCPEGYFERLIESGKALMLLDGLDEVSPQARRVEVAGQIAALANASHAENVWIVTSRIVGYPGTLNQHGFRQTVVQDLSPHQIDAFVQSWYERKLEADAFPPDEKEYQAQKYRERARHLSDSLKTNVGLASLAKNPMILSLVTLLHSVRLELPDSRSLLYRDCVELLLDRWDVSRGLRLDAGSFTLYQKVDLLAEVAWSLHKARKKEISATDFRSELLRQIVREGQTGSGPDVDGLIQRLEERSGLILSRGTDALGEKIFAFSHLSFQEYLVADRMRKKGEQARTWVLESSDDTWWKESILLYMAMANDPDDLVREIYEVARRDALVSRLIFAGACVAEVQVSKDEPLYGSVLADLAYLASGGACRDADPACLAEDHRNVFLRFLVARLNEEVGRRPRTLAFLYHQRMQQDSPEDWSDLLAEIHESGEPAWSITPVVALAAAKREIPLELQVELALAPSEEAWPEELWDTVPWEEIQAVSSAIVNGDHLIPRIPQFLARLQNLRVWPGLSQVIIDQVQCPWLRHMVWSASLGDEGGAEASSSIVLRDRRNWRDFWNFLPVIETLPPEMRMEVAAQFWEPSSKRLDQILRLRGLLLTGPSEERKGAFWNFVIAELDRQPTSPQGPPSGLGEDDLLLSTAHSRILLGRCLAAIEEEEEVGSVRWLMSCAESRLPDALDFVRRVVSARSIALDSADLAMCSEALSLDRLGRWWVAAHVLSRSSVLPDGVVSALLARLYDSENQIYGKPVRDVAGQALLRLVDKAAG